MNMTKAPVRLCGAMMLLAWALLAHAAWAQGGPIRIVVLPFYTEAGTQVTDGGFEGRHYRRVSRYINNQLVRHGFEVINPTAHIRTEEEYNRLREVAREDSILAARELTRQFTVDVVYLVWLDVDTQVTGDGYCKARAAIEGEGYDSAARDIGAGLDRIFRMTRRDCDDAIIEVEKLAGDEVGRILTASAGRTSTGEAGTAGSTGTAGGGVVERTSGELASLINVRLVEATRYELVEAFGKVINTARGAVEATPYGMVIQPENPQASYANWRVRIENTEPFRFQANVMTMLEKIYDFGGEVVIKGVPYRYTPAEVDLLKAIRPGDSTSRSIVFVVDRDRAQEIEFASGTQGRSNRLQNLEPSAGAQSSPPVQVSPIRIVVVPFYTEAGTQVTDGGFEGRHYRRVMRYINNQLVRRGFEVINPTAHEYTEEEYNRLREVAREDSMLAARELTKRFAVDVVYLIWLDVETRVTGDGYCKARAAIEGEGYDSAARDIGAGLDRIFRNTRRDCDDAIIEVEKLGGDEVGRILTASAGRMSTRGTGIKGTTGTGGGVIKDAAGKLASLINVRLAEATRYELVEVFGKVINTARGVVEAKPYGMVIKRENPKASYANWRVGVENTELFRFQANVMTMLKEIYQSGGRIVVKGVPYRYTPAEVDLLKAIRPGSSTSGSIVFVVDRDRARDIEFSSGYD